MPKVDALLESLNGADKSTDLHIAAFHPPLVRRAGRIEPLREAPLTPEEVDELLFEIVTNEQRMQIVERLDFDFAYLVGERTRFRVNFFHTTTGLGAVFRRIPSEILSLEDLGCPEAVRRACDRKGGLVLVTGPTGSGKSTTLAAMVNHVNETRPCHILTIEDPVEFVHESKRAQVTHREVGPDTPSFAVALQSAARENADVLLVGELRDRDTMRLALEAASYGLLIFSTVPASSAASAVDRFLTAFTPVELPEVRGLLAECLVAVVAQQLLRTADGRGRAVAFEILLGSTALSGMIRDGKSSEIVRLMQAGHAVGMQTMDMALEQLVVKGTVTYDEALIKASDKEAFQKLNLRRS